MIIEILLTVAFVILLVFGIAHLVNAARKQRELFERQFPPISDEEFVARCSPGTSPNIAIRVRRILSDSLGVEYGRIYPSSRFVEDLFGADDCVTEALCKK